MNVVVILGNQLFPVDLIQSRGLDPRQTRIYMREDRGLCTYVRHHQQKIVLFLAAMRAYAEELRACGFPVHYEQLDQDQLTYEQALLAFLKQHKARHIYHWEIEDNFFQERLRQALSQDSWELQEWESPMFLTSRPLFSSYLKEVKKPFMKTFYERQRVRLGILVDKKGKPVGGQWSFDEDNRHPLPLDITPPELPRHRRSKLEQEVIELVNREFADHPGSAEESWLPCHRQAAQKWLDDFLAQRLELFGPYEDALARHSPFVYHSVLTPFLNLGLITPGEVLKKTLAFAAKHETPLNSLEGFVRQILGWREFIRGIYHNFHVQQETRNFWQHGRRLSHHWYEGTTGIQPLDDVIAKTLRYGYAHHIERLMVVGSLMLLLEIDPREAHRWFMEMYVDSSDWVMGPNVYGMALFSDGGIFATKPYICGSNYYRKMGPYKSGSWQPGVDGLYWTFIDRHRSFFTQNPRLGMMVRTLDKMSADKHQHLREAAGQLRERLTRDPD
jgi:deoxyribodipyrimidine photolyase-related protein